MYLLLLYKIKGAINQPMVVLIFLFYINSDINNNNNNNNNIINVGFWRDLLVNKL